MNGLDKPLIRASGVVVLLMLTTLALRSYQPSAKYHPAEPRPRPSSRPDESASPILLLALSAIAVLFVLWRLRRRRRKPSSADSPSYLRLRGLSRHEVAIAVAGAIVVVGLLLLPLYLLRPADQSPVQAPLSDASEQQQPDSAEHHRISADPPAQRQSQAPVMILAAVLVGAAVMIFVMKKRGSSAADGDLEQSAIPEGAKAISGSLAHLVELGLAEVADPGRDPRASIIACYVAMERGLNEAPEAAPLASDTPSEVLQRAVHRGALQSHAGTQLVSLFSEARFSPHRMTQTDRESAVHWLQTVLDDLRSRR